jgi:hypothetical protein
MTACDPRRAPEYAPAGDWHRLPGNRSCSTAPWRKHRLARRTSIPSASASRRFANIDAFIESCPTASKQVANAPQALRGQRQRLSIAA